MTQKIENVIGTENRSRAGVEGGWMTRKVGGTGLSRTGLCGSGGSWKWRRAPAVCGAAAGPVSDAAAAQVAAAGLPVAQLVIWWRRAAYSFFRAVCAKCNQSFYWHWPIFCHLFKFRCIILRIPDICHFFYTGKIFGE